MSYIAKKGKAAAESAKAEGNGKKDYSDALVKLKSGDSIVVKLPDAESFVEYHAASVFKIFYTTPVEPGNNAYETAAKALYKKLDETDDEAYKDFAYQIKPKPRYLFGFIDLDSGKPIVVDFTKNQAKTLISAIDKYAKKVDKIAFTLAKEGQSTSTTVSLTPVIDMDDTDEISSKQREHFDAAVADKVAVPDDLYENVLYVKDADEQADDIKTFAQKNGLDAGELGVVADPGGGGGGNAPANDPTDVF